MAEPFGIATGAVGIAATFTTYVNGFGYVQLGRHFGRDFQTYVLAQLRQAWFDALVTNRQHLRRP